MSELETNSSQKPNLSHKNCLPSRKRRSALSRQSNVLACPTGDGTKAYRAFAAAGVTLERAHTYNKAEQHGFINSQRMGMGVFKKIPQDVPIVVARPPGSTVTMS
jgi:hypothetical protein